MWFFFLLSVFFSYSSKSIRVFVNFLFVHLLLLPLLIEKLLSSKRQNKDTYSLKFNGKLHLVVNDTINDYICDSSPKRKFNALIIKRIIAVKTSDPPTPYLSVNLRFDYQMMVNFFTILFQFSPHRKTKTTVPNSKYPSATTFRVVGPSNPYLAATS